MSKVLPGMQSAFVDLGLERDGFLYVADVVNTLEEFERLSGDEDDDDAAATAAERTVGSGAPKRGQAPAQSGGRGRGPRRPRRRDKGGERAEGPEPKIEELLKEGQDIIVQVAKEPLGTKGARLTSHVTMPGRFLVFMPTVDHVGVSRKIDYARGTQPPARHRQASSASSTISAAASSSAPAAEASPRKTSSPTCSTSTACGPRCGRSRKQRAPRPWSSSEPSLVAKLLRDLLTDDYSAIRIDDADGARRASLELIEPHHAGACRRA